VGEVRGLGLWVAVDFTADRATRAPADGATLKAVVARARELGVLVSRNGSAIEVAPPLVISREELDEGLGAFMRAVREVCA
jgi:putrescine aminotransferase